MVAARFGRNRAVSAISARIGPVRHKPARISTQQKKKSGMDACQRRRRISARRVLVQPRQRCTCAF